MIKNNKERNRRQSDVDHIQTTYKSYIYLFVYYFLIEFIGTLVNKIIQVSDV